MSAKFVILCFLVRLAFSIPVDESDVKDVEVLSGNSREKLGINNNDSFRHHIYINNLIEKNNNEINIEEEIVQKSLINPNERINGPVENEATKFANYVNTEMEDPIPSTRSSNFSSFDTLVSVSKQNDESKEGRSKRNSEPITHTNDTVSRTGSAHDLESHGENHGVHLVSWRWDSYRDLISICLTIILAAIFKVIFHHTHILSNNVPESCVLIIIGILLGILVYFGIDEHSSHFPKFTNDLFFNVLLPPIILDSAYNLYDRDFLGNLGSILLFAVVGTLFNVFVIGFSLYGLASVGWMGTMTNPLGAIEALIFSSLISAVDPVAVLAIFQEIGVNMGLYFLVFGESLLNDGVTVVLYNTMSALQMQATIDGSQYIIAFFSFFTVCLGGLTIGFIIGCMTAFFLKYTQDTRVIEPLVVFVMSYLAYIMAETVHWSGIISLIACGIAQKRYAFPNISKKSYTTVKYGVQTMSALSDCIIFLFLGIVTLSHRHEWHTGFALWTIALCTIVRFVGVYLLSALINLRRIKKISLKEQFILSYGGLRGAVGFSLVTLLDDGSHFKDIFVTTTLFVIFFTVFIQGSTIKFLVSKLKIQKKTTEAKLLFHDVSDRTNDFLMAGVESVTGKISRYTVLEAIVNFDSKYFKKWLIANNAEHNLALRCQKISLSDHYARLYGPAIMVHHCKETRNLATDEEVNAQTARKPSVNPSIALGDKFHADNKWSRVTLKKAFSGSAYERYKAKNFGMDSIEDVEQDMKLKTDKWQNAIQKLTSDNIKAKQDKEQGLKVLQESPHRQETNVDEYVSLLMPTDRAAVARIRRVYENTKQKHRHTLE